MLPSLPELGVKLQKQVDRISNVLVELKTILFQPKKVALSIFSSKQSSQGSSSQGSSSNCPTDSDVQSEQLVSTE